jgi:hypothetical protein
VVSGADAGLEPPACGAFTEATQRDLLHHCTHWPAAEVYAVLAPAAARIIEDVAGLKRIVAAPVKTEAGQ